MPERISKLDVHRRPLPDDAFLSFQQNLWFYAARFCETPRGPATMAYEWDGRRSRRVQMIKFAGAVLVPVILLASAITPTEWTRGY